jgi:hypothetical protein
VTGQRAEVEVQEQEHEQEQVNLLLHLFKSNWPAREGVSAVLWQPQSASDEYHLAAVTQCSYTGRWK